MVALPIFPLLFVECVSRCSCRRVRAKPDKAPGALPPINIEKVVHHQSQIVKAIE